MCYILTEFRNFDFNPLDKTRKGRDSIFNIHNSG